MKVIALFSRLDLVPVLAVVVISLVVFFKVHKSNKIRRKENYKKNYEKYIEAKDKRIAFESGCYAHNSMYELHLRAFIATEAGALHFLMQHYPKESIRFGHDLLELYKRIGDQATH